MTGPMIGLKEQIMADNNDGLPVVILAAGGTGGHVFPALAVADELKERGFYPVLITDPRGQPYCDAASSQSGLSVHVLPAGRLRGRGRARDLLDLPAAFFGIARGLWQAWRLIRAVNPRVVVGFGGYPAFPSMMAARILGLPTAVHEQNAVLGRTNRFLARRANLLALSFDETKGLGNHHWARAEVIGNPVRREISRLHDQSYPQLHKDGLLRILVLGGSQGASVLSEVVPEALALLPLAQRRRIQITQQCRAEDIDQVRAKYDESEIACQLATFLDDVPNHLVWTNLVISRAGASTLAEVTAAGRPAILVPYPSATDDHQTANAWDLVEAGGAWLMPQGGFTAAALAKIVQKMATSPDQLSEAAGRSRLRGRPDAAASFVDLLEGLAGVSSAARTLPDETTDNTDPDHSLERSLQVILQQITRDQATQGGAG